MTKKTTRRRSPGTPVDEVGHLDETLTEVTTTTAATLKKYRYHMVATVALVSLIIVGIAGAVALQEGGVVSKNRELWNLLQSPAAQKAGPSLEAIDQLLTDARDSTAERYIIKSVGDYLLSRAIADSDETTSGVSKEQARTRALALASDAAARYLDDEDLQSWADSLEKKLEGEWDTSWIPPNPRYALPSVSAETKDS